MTDLGPFDLSLASMQPDHLSGASAWIEHIPFAFWLIQTLRPGVLVELGTHRGDSYCAFCQAARLLQLRSQFTAIDTWQGDAHAGFYAADLYAELAAYHDPRYGGFSTLLREEFEQASERFADASVDLLHIDGFHSYAAARRDFEQWLPKLSARAVVLFHDIEHQSDSFGVGAYWCELKQRYPHFEFSHGNGLGVLLVGAEVPADFRAAIGYANAHAAQVREAFYRLAMQVTRLQRQRYSAFRLYIDRDGQYRNETGVLQQVVLQKGECELCFDCGDPPVSANKVFRFDPGELPLVLRLIDVMASDADAGPLGHRISVSNALLQVGELYLFDQLDPHIYIDIDEPQLLRTLRLRYEVLAVDSDVDAWIRDYLAAHLDDPARGQWIIQHRPQGAWGQILAGLLAQGEAR